MLHVFKPWRWTWKALNACKDDCVWYCYKYRCKYAMISLYYWTVGTSVLTQTVWYPRNIKDMKLQGLKNSGSGPDELKSDEKRSPELAFVHPVSGVTKQNPVFSSAPSLRLSWTLQKRKIISIRHMTSNSSQLLQSWSRFTQNKKCFGCSYLGKGISCGSRSDSSDSLSTA